MAAGDVWEKRDISVSKVDNSSVLTMESGVYLPRKHMGFEKDLVNRERSMTFKILFKTLCGIVH